jgi:branched-subunit amino acid transport protein
MIDVFQLLTLLGLAAMTVLTRCFFFILNRELPFPAWAQRGLQYAPIAVLSAVVIPEVVMQQGELISTLQDARLYAAAVGAAVYFWHRDVLQTIVLGMAVYLPLHVGWGW